MTEPSELIAKAQEVVRKAEQAGADEAEAYLWKGSGDRVMRGGRLQMAQESDQSGVSVRIVQNERLASACTDGLHDRDLSWAVERALASVPHLPKSTSFHRFPEPRGDPGPPSPVHKAVLDPDVDRIMATTEKVADRIEGSKGIDYFEIYAGAYRGTYAVSNSRGLTAWDRNAYERCSVELRYRKGAEHKNTRSGLYAREPIEFESVLSGRVDEAIELVASTRNQGELDSGASVVVFDPQASGSLLPPVTKAAHGVDADRGNTAFSDRLGERVATEELTLIDKPRASDGVRLQRTDDEGIPTQATPIIEDGVLGTFLYDWAGSLEVDASPTGHGYRGRTKRHEGGPSTKTCNLEVAPGDWSQAEMIEDIQQGVFVKGPFLGSFTSDPISGDFSLVAPLAFRIEDGRIQEAVPSTTVSGNMYEMLEGIRGIGDDPRRQVNGAFPSLYVEGVDCVA